MKKEEIIERLVASDYEIEEIRRLGNDTGDQIRLTN